MHRNARNLVLAVIAVPAAFVCSNIYKRLTTLGVLRGHVENIHGLEGLRLIPGTGMCEDLHREEINGQLFTACQQSAEQRARWFPPLLALFDPTALGDGSLVRIDPVSMTATNLKLRNFRSTMVTHGIDILNDLEDANVLWIHVVNHLPNPDRWNSIPTKRNLPPERPRIELFRHQLNTDEAIHVRSVRHPGISMPNDILAISPSSFYVTNDHVHYEGVWRTWEDLGTQSIAPTPNTVWVQVTDLVKSENVTSGVQVTEALRAVHNNNGLGRASVHRPGDATIIDASGGVVTRVRKKLPRDIKDGHFTIVERIQMASTLDNPSYYDDHYATPADNASGYILPGLVHGYKLQSDFPNLERPIPSLVWHLRSNSESIDREGKKNRWEKRLIFQDNGQKLRSASGAVLVGIDPKTNNGKKQGWLFVTGFASSNVVALKIDL